MKESYRTLKPLVLWRQEKRPVDWSARFGRIAPVSVEIGFGNGEFLVREALEHPERNFIGIELHWESVKRLLRRIDHCGATNVLVLLGDAKVVLERLFEPRSTGAIYSLFPCPWPKDRHEKHRLFGRPFLRLMNSRLIDGAEARIVTDHEPYLRWIADRAGGTGFAMSWKSAAAAFDTKYERKWRARGQSDFFDIRLVKETHTDVPLKEDVSLKTYHVDRFVPESFEPAGCRGEVVVVFKEFLYDPLRRKGMAKAFIAEQDLRQTVWVEIVRTEKDWFIRPEPGGIYIPTVGVQRAIDLVRDCADDGAGGEEGSTPGPMEK